MAVDPKLAVRQAYALAHPLNGPYDSTEPYTTVRAHARGFLLMSILAVDRRARLNDGLPVWHASVSVWSKDQTTKRPAPGQAEAEAVRLLRDVGDPDREWWIWNPPALVGHLRVPVTPAEYELVPPGCVVGDAGETGPLRGRTR